MKRTREYGVYDMVRRLPRRRGTRGYSNGKIRVSVLERYTRVRSLESKYR